MWNAPICSKRASICRANRIVLSVEGVHGMTRAFLKQLKDEVRVKIILIFSSHWWCFATAASATCHCQFYLVYNSNNAHRAKNMWPMLKKNTSMKCICMKGFLTWNQHKGSLSCEGIIYHILTNWLVWMANSVWVHVDWSKGIVNVMNVCFLTELTNTGIKNYINCLSYIWLF